MPYHRIAAGAALSDPDEQFCTVQRKISFDSDADLHVLCWNGRWRVWHDAHCTAVDRCNPFKRFCHLLYDKAAVCNGFKGHGYCVYIGIASISASADRKNAGAFSL